MKILCFIVIVFLGIGCKPRPIFECPENIVYKDKIIKVSDSTGWAFPDQLTLQALAYCNEHGQIVMRERDSIASLLANIKPVYKYSYKEVQVRDSVADKELLKSIALKAWDEGYKFGIAKNKAEKEKTDLITWKNIIAAFIVLVFIVLLIKLFK